MGKWGLGYGGDFFEGFFCGFALASWLFGFLASWLFGFLVYAAFFFCFGFSHPLLSQFLSGRWLFDLCSLSLALWLWLPASSASPVPLRHVLDIFGVYPCMYIIYAIDVIYVVYEIYVGMYVCPSVCMFVCMHFFEHHGWLGRRPEVLSREGD